MRKACVLQMISIKSWCLINGRFLSLLPCVNKPELELKIKGNIHLPIGFRNMWQLEDFPERSMDLFFWYAFKRAGGNVRVNDETVPCATRKKKLPRLFKRWPQVWCFFPVRKRQVNKAVMETFRFASYFQMALRYYLYSGWNQSHWNFP